MKDEVMPSRKDELEKLIFEAQNMPGIIDLMKVYGGFDELILKSREYLDAFKPKTITTLSNNSS
jgi:hypothetical protein